MLEPPSLTGQPGRTFQFDFETYKRKRKTRSLDDDKSFAVGSTDYSIPSIVKVFIKPPQELSPSQIEILQKLDSLNAAVV